MFSLEIELLFIVIRDWSQPVQYLKQVTGLSPKKQIRDFRHKFSIIPICFKLGKGSEKKSGKVWSFAKKKTSDHT